MRIGITEVLLIIVIAIAVLKPEKLPEYAKRLGALTREISKSKAAIDDATEEVTKDTTETSKEGQ